MRIDELIKNTEAVLENSRTQIVDARHDPTELMAVIFKFIRAVYPKGHLIGGVGTGDDDIEIYRRYPNYLSMRHAWKTKVERTTQLEYPTIVPIAHYLRDVDLKAVLSKRSMSLPTTQPFSATPIDHLEAYRYAIEELGVAPMYYPAEFKWTSLSGATDYSLVLTINLEKNVIENVNIGIRDAIQHGCYVTNTLFSTRGRMIDTTIYDPPFEKYARRVGIALSRANWVTRELNSITRRLTNAGKLNHSKVTLGRYLTETPIIPSYLGEHVRPESFISDYPPPDACWERDDDCATPGDIYHRWLDRETNITYVGILTRRRVKNGGLGILWFALKYEDDQMFYILSDASSKEVIRSMPIKTICDRKDALGFPINFKQWLLAMTIIDQLIRKDVGE